MAVVVAVLAPASVAAQAPAPGGHVAQVSTADPALTEASRLADARRFAEAIVMLRGRLELAPSDRAARSLLARLLAWEKRYGESIAEYERLLLETPEAASERAGYARVLAWSGRIEDAIAEFRRAMEDDPDDIEIRVAYARAMSWIGDLPGAAMEYRRILGAHPEHGDAWLGYATVARWRAGATASDRFLPRAEAHGADPAATDEERAAVRAALAPALGGGWTRSQERQYVAGPDFTLRSSGPHTQARVTIGRTADLTMRAAWLAQSERAGTGVLNYDLDARLVRADLALLRGYPFMAAAGLESRHITPGAAGVSHPLLGAGNFTGWNARSWWFLGRVTPALAVRREFVPLKVVSPVSELTLGHQTVVEGTLAWQWSGRGSARAGVERGDYSDGNARVAARAGAAYRARVRQPSVSFDYAVGYTDFDTTSASYFTPLVSWRHVAGVGLEGYTARRGLSYGARYEFSTVGSDNFEAIRTHTWSARVNAAELGPVGLGLDGAYSRDNNAYEVWSLGLHATAHW